MSSNARDKCSVTVACLIPCHSDDDTHIINISDSWNKLIPSMTLIDSRPGFKRLLDGLIVNPYTEDD